MLKSQEEISITRQLQEQFPSFFFSSGKRQTQVKTVRDQWQHRFQKLQHFVRERTRANVHFGYPSVVIGGTSGKGSSAQLLARVLAYRGRRVGIFTSPHLVSLRERFWILNADAEQEPKLWMFLDKKSQELKRIYPDLSYFEALFLLADAWFSECGCEWVVWEAGCGGRWDATNTLVHKRLVILTHIELDHQDLLGSTRHAIAREKAPLLSHSDACVMGEKDPDIRAILEQEQRYWKSKLLTETYPELSLTQDEKGRISLGDRRQDKQIPTGLYGEGQQNNLTGVAMASKFLGVPLQDFEDALAGVSLEGRIECLQDHPTVVLDIAHNPHKLGNLLSTLKRWPASKRFALVAFSEGKDVDTMLNMLGGAVDEIWISVYQEGQGRRGCLLSEIEACAEKLGLLDRIIPSPSLSEALAQVRPRLNSEDLLMVTGSTFLYAEVKAWWT